MTSKRAKEKLSRNQRGVESLSLLRLKFLGNFTVVEKEESKNSLTLEIPPLDWIPSGRMYGGSIAANMFLAAARIAKPNHYPLTMSVDYLVIGDYKKPQRYEVSCLRSSERFTHVSIFLRQNGEITAAGKASFHVQEEKVNLPYSTKFPRSVSMPEETTHGIEIWNGLLDSSAGNMMAQQMYSYWQAALRIFGMESLLASTKLTKHSTNLCHWIRFRDQEIYDHVSDFGIHWSAALLTWASDFHPMLTIICQQPDYGARQTVCSLSHFLWFSSDPNVQLRLPTKEWFLHETIVQMSGNNIGVCEGRLWTRDGKLLALVKHHGLTRPKL